MQPSSLKSAAAARLENTTASNQQAQMIHSNMSSPSKVATKTHESSKGLINSMESPNILYFPLPGTDVNSFKNHLSLTPSHERDWSLFHSEPSSTSEPEMGTGPVIGGTHVHGKVVRLNGRELALFYYKDKFYAVNEKCPHLGGPLHLGDIEELPGTNDQCSPHIVCPWHKWCFELSTGRQIRPLGRHRDVETFPVRTDDNGRIFIGFVSIDPSYFVSYDF